MDIKSELENLVPKVKKLFSLSNGWLYSKTGGLRLKSGKLLLLGLDNAGKTTLLSVLKAGHITQPMPTLHPSKQADEAITQQHLTAHVASWK